MNYLSLVCALIGVAGVLYSIIIATLVKSAPAGSERMQQIAGAIREGAVAYLNRQMKSMGIAGAVIFVIILITMKATTAIGFLVGAIASYVAGYVGNHSVDLLRNLRRTDS